jgi:hypothetical protein
MALAIILAFVLKRADLGLCPQNKTIYLAIHGKQENKILTWDNLQRK